MAKQNNKNPLPPTYSDSLRIYNNALQVENYYKKYQKARTKDQIIGPDWVSNLEYDNKDFSRFEKKRNTPQGIRTVKPEEYHKKVNDYQFYQRESADAMLDTNSPFPLYDKRIKPQKRVNRINADKNSKMYGDDVLISIYDPLAIKPAALLSDKELQERYKKYGKSGLSSSQIEKLQNKITQKTNLQKQEYEEIPLLPLKPLVPIEHLQAPEKMELRQVPIEPGNGRGMWSDGSKGDMPKGMSTEDFKRKNQEYQRKLLESKQNNNLSQVTFKEGGPMSIHINPENKGKFNATKARTGKTTEELTHSSNPLTRKRAIFAQNAAKWHHGEGGPLLTSMMDVQPNEYKGDDGLIKSTIALGNEFGHPALQRMTSPNPKTYDFGNGNLGTHYMASMGEYAVPLLQDKGGDQLEYNENPAPGPEDIKFRNEDEANYFAENYKRFAPMMKNFRKGGNLYPMGGTMTTEGQPNMDPSAQLTEFNGGGSHEDNPNGGIPQGVAPNGAQNLVEEGETKLNAKNYVFSDTLKIDKSIADEFYFPKKFIGKTFAEVSKSMNRPNSRREFDQIEEKQKEKDLNALMSAQELFKQKEYMKDMEMMMQKHGDFLSPGMEQPEGERKDFGGFLQKAGQFGKNWGMALADTAMSTFGANDVIKDNAYSGVGANFFKKGVDIAGTVGKATAQIGANIIAPGVGGAVMGGIQKGIGNATHYDPNTGQPAQPIQIFRKGGGLKEGPLTQEDSEYLDTMYPSTSKILIPYALPNASERTYMSEQRFQNNETPEEYESNARKIEEESIRKNKKFNSFWGGGELVKGDFGTNPQQELLGKQLAFTPGEIIDDGNYEMYPQNDLGQQLTFNPGEIMDEGNYGNVPMSETTSTEQVPEWVFDMNKRSVLSNNESGVTPSGNEYDRTSSFDPNLNDVQDTHIKQSGLNALGQYAPVIGNIGMGLFMKPQKLNPNDYTNNAKLVNWRNNINPQLKAIDEGYAMGANGIRSASSGAGNYLTNMQELATSKMKNEAEVHANAENQYNERQLQIDQINAARGDQNAQMRLQIADWNAKAKAAKQQTLMKGIEGIGDIADANQRDKVGMEYAKMMAPDFKDKVSYQSFIDYLSGKIK